MTFKCNSIYWIVGLCHDKIRIFGWSRIKKFPHSAIRQLESSFFDFIQIAFRQKMSSNFLATTRKVALLNSIKPLFGLVQRSKIGWKCQEAPWKNAYSIIQVAFLDGQEAVNEFKVTWKLLIHRLLDYTLVAFWAGQEEENEFPVPGDHLKHCFLELYKLEFWAYQEAENDFKVPFDGLNRLFVDLKKVAFSVDKKQKMISKCHWTTWIIGFYTSSKSHLGLVKRLKMRSQCFATTRKVALLN